jgi:hypothetical protein
MLQRDTGNFCKIPFGSDLVNHGFFSNESWSFCALFTNNMQSQLNLLDGWM